MALRKSPLLSTAASLIALSALTGCATTNSLFGSREPLTAEAHNAMNYDEAMKRGNDAREDGDMKEAATNFMRAGEYQPDKVEPLIALADVLWQEKKASESAKVLEHAHRMDGQNPTILRNLGRAYVAMNEPEKAEHAYLSALELEPNNPRTFNGLAIAYDMKGDHDTAQKHYRDGLAVDPNNTDLKNNLAYSLITSKKFDEAIAILEPLVKHPNATQRQRSNLALAYGLSGRDEEAKLTLAEDHAPAQVQRNLDTYRQMRGEPTQSASLTDVGRPTFERGNLATSEPEPAMAPPPAAVTPVEPPPPAPSELVGVPDGSVLVKPEDSVLDKPMPIAQPVIEQPRSAPVASPSVVMSQPVQAQPQPTDLVATSTPATAAAEPLSVPGTTVNAGLGNAKIYLGKFDNEALAREAWIKVWTANSSTLSSLVASIEPNNGQMALYAVGADSNSAANDVCLKLRQNGVSCGVSQ